MSLTVKGFVTNQSKVNNTVTNGKGEVALFGELSPNSKTFARELGYYTVPNTDYGIVTFTSKDENNNTVELPDTLISIINETIKWTWLLSTQVVPTTYAEFIYKFKNAFGARGVTDLSIGEIKSDGDSTLPDFIEFTYAGDNEVKLWFTDEAFANQYDDFELQIITPLRNIDDFWLSFNELKLKLENSNNPYSISLAIKEARDAYPFTDISTEVVTFTNPTNQNETIQTYWLALIYGAAGSNPDIIREKIIEHVLSISKYSRDAWARIMPGLFKQNEFYIVPEWNNIAIETTAVANKGVNSIITNATKGITKLTKIASDYPSFHISNFCDIWSTAYKPLAIYSIAHPDTRDKKYSIKDWYKDYLPVTTASYEFNRMSDITQDWVFTLYAALKAAEFYTNRRSLPRQFSLVERNGKLFVCFTHNQNKFMIYAKINDAGTL